ncbi:hypothetical protein BDEG_25952 [Batrachochytrium dendrobatidis JEL423]|uniref:Uncharacterized protein n=1 Tax=Batrachochytrium dendrobatidis (strain JEL423) TaxID=403673 RepID=A0A177WSW4_BATDL|nr:hypothetical protein BDEG_25952 [Batrachochytrium dendrobatidis JEL423]
MAVKPLVSTAGCLNISDLAKAIKQELSPKLNSYSSAQLTLHKTSDDTALEPDLPLASISTAECRPLDSFSKYLVESNDDLKQILEGKGSALYQLFNPKDKIIKFKQLINGEKYNVYSRYERSFADEVRWQQNEDKAMEEETHLAVRRFLATHLGPSAVDMPTDIMAADGKTIVQEWDAVFKDGDVLYLCEAKHNMTFEQVNKLPARIRKFKEFQANAQPEFRNVTKYAGVLCGTLFPEDIRKNAHLGFICVYPSGYRYDVKKPEDFIIER